MLEMSKTKLHTTVDARRRTIQLVSEDHYKSAKQRRTAGTEKSSVAAETPQSWRLRAVHDAVRAL